MTNIRICEITDLPAVLAIYAPYVEQTTISFEYEVPSPEAFEARYREITEKYPWLVWEEDGEILGYAYASAPFSRAAYGWCSEPSIYLRPEARGRGIGKALYDALEKILIYQGFQISYAIITGENTASMHFHEKCGYSFLAEFPNCGQKFDRRLSVVWMHKQLKPVEVSSFTPVPWMAIVQNAQTFSDILSILSIS